MSTITRLFGDEICCTILVQIRGLMLVIKSLKYAQGNGNLITNSQKYLVDENLIVFSCETSKILLLACKSSKMITNI